MTTNLKFFKNKKFLPTDEFLYNVLYDKKIGYYSRKEPFGISGDFITSPKVSDLFSEIIAIWIISVWKVFGKPKKINIVELGPGDGSLSKILLKIFERFPEFNDSKKMYLFEISNRLKNLQKNKITKKKVKWIKDFNEIKNGPVIFFGNEFFDAIPIQQFKNNKGKLYKKYFSIQEQGIIKEIFKKASKKETSNILNYKSLKNLKFIEFLKMD